MKALIEIPIKLINRPRLHDSTSNCITCDFYTYDLCGIKWAEKHDRCGCGQTGYYEFTNNGKGRKGRIEE